MFLFIFIVSIELFSSLVLPFLWIFVCLFLRVRSSHLYSVPLCSAVMLTFCALLRIALCCLVYSTPVHCMDGFKQVQPQMVLTKMHQVYMKELPFIVFQMCHFCLCFVLCVLPTFDIIFQKLVGGDIHSFTHLHTCRHTDMPTYRQIYEHTDSYSIHTHRHDRT